MATVGGLSSSATSQIRGYGGLASGLDRDSLIESMTAGTTTKIENKQKEKQKIEWKQEAIRGITDKLYDFTQTYMSYASNKNLLGSTIYSSSTITALGSNSNKLSVKGLSSSAKSMSITGIKQLAKNAQVNFNSNASDQSLSSGAIGKLTDKKEYNVIANSGLTIKYGSNFYAVTLPESGDGYKYDTAQDVANSMNKAFSTVSIGNGRKLSDVVSVDQAGGRFYFTNKDIAGGTVALGGQQNNLLNNLGFLYDGATVGDMDDEDLEIGVGGLWAKEDAILTQEKTAAQMLGGKSITFTYNGKAAEITMMDANVLGNVDGANWLVSDMQSKLDNAFGKGRIKVSFNETDGLSFETRRPDGTPDTSSILEITSADRGVLGKYGVFSGINKGDSNRLNLKTDLATSGLAYFKNMTSAEQKNFLLTDKDSLTINGVSIEVKNGDSIQDIMDRINSSEAGVKMSYLRDADRFVLSSTQSGACGQVTIEGTIGEMLFGAEKNTLKGLQDSDQLLVNGGLINIQKGDSMTKVVESINNADVGVQISYSSDTGEYTLRATKPGVTLDSNLSVLGGSLKALFGTATANGDGTFSGTIQPSDSLFGGTDSAYGYTVQQGQDAIMEVAYEGSAPIEIVRDSNTFTLNDLTFTLKGEFDSNDADSDPITFEAEVNSEKAIETMREMVTMFNEIIKLVNDEVSTKPNRDYDPLTTEQEAEMTENQIKAWTEKAKAGMLFNDSDIRSLASALRTVVSNDSTALAAIGLEVSSNYSDNGKLIFNEATFKEALENDASSVIKTLTSAMTTDDDGYVSNQGGFFVRLKNIMDKYASTTGSTKGVLIERAGSTHAPTSILTNALQKQLDRIDDQIDDLLDRLETEQDRYISQFTTLESLISQMNSQSSWLSGAFGG